MTGGNLLVSAARGTGGDVLNGSGGEVGNLCEQRHVSNAIASRHYRAVLTATEQAGVRAFVVFALHVNRHPLW